MNYGWRFMILYRRQGSRPCTGIKTGINIPKKKEYKKIRWLSEEVLQIAVKRREKQRRKGKIYPFECRA